MAATLVLAVNARNVKKAFTERSGDVTAFAS